MGLNYFVPDVNVEEAKRRLRQQGFKVSYRNRGGKQYLTIKSEEAVTSSVLVTILKSAGVDYPWHTSGSRYEHTFRINPDEYYRDYLEKWK